MTGSSKIVNAEQTEAFLEQFDDFLFDCDGVLWSGSKLLPSVKETIDLLRSRGKRLIFVTNNSTKSRKAYTKKFESFGISVTKDEIFGSSYSAAIYLSKVLKLPKDQKVLVVGERGLEEELEEVGINYVGGTDPNLRKVEASEEDLASLKYDPSIGAVVCGLDFHITYFKIATALIQLQNEKTKFLATNIDSTYPNHGMLLPGAGTIVATLATSSGREPTSLGKPSNAMLDSVKAKFELNPSRTCMIGDRLNTDIAFGKAGGFSTLLVLSGVAKESEIDPASNPAVVPDFYVDKLGSLFEYIKTK